MRHPRSFVSRLRYLAAPAAGALIVVACSGEREKTAEELAVEANAALLCHKLFSCCTPTELDALPFVDDAKPPSEDGCVAYHTRTALAFLPVLDREAAAGRIAARVERSAACVERLRAESCSEFHRRLPRLHVGDAYRLCTSEIVEPLVDDGRACTIYLDCKGGSCETPGGGAADGGADAIGTCRSLPAEGEACAADGCAADLRCDPDTTLCAPYVEVGGDCVDDNACASGACRGGRCVSPGRCGG